jgi:hypothetical protein
MEIETKTLLLGIAAGAVGITAFVWQWQHSMQSMSIEVEVEDHLPPIEGQQHAMDDEDHEALGEHHDVVDDNEQPGDAYTDDEGTVETSEQQPGDAGEGAAEPNVDQDIVQEEEQVNNAEEPEVELDHEQEVEDIQSQIEEALKEENFWKEEFNKTEVGVVTKRNREANKKWQMARARRMQLMRRVNVEV